MEYIEMEKGKEKMENQQLTPVKEIVTMKQVVNDKKSYYRRTITSTINAGDFGMNEIGDEASEVVLVVILNTKNDINAVHRVFVGGLNSSYIHPREIFRTAIMNNGARIILFHNHPSGNVIPSEADLEVTRKLIKAGDTVGIEVLDHIVVSQDSCHSMREEGEIYSQF